MGGRTVSWFHDLLIRLGGGEPEPKPEPFELVKATPHEIRMHRLTERAQELLDEQKQINARVQRHYQKNPYRNVEAFHGWNIRPTDPNGALPVVFTVRGERIPDEDVIGWGGETYRRVLTYRDKRDSESNSAMVEEPEFLRWKNRQLVAESRKGSTNE